MREKVLPLLVAPGPYHPDSEMIYPPVIPRGALLIAGCARAAGWRASVFDAYSFHGASAAFEERSLHASVIGISVHGAPSVNAAREAVDSIQRRASRTPVIVGGNLANVAPDLLRKVFSDCSLFDGGASSIVDVLEETLLNQTPAFYHIPNPDLSWETPDLDALHTPIESYLSDPDFEYNVPTQIGCPFRCFHCGTGRQGLFSRVMLRPLASLTQELDALAARCKRSGATMPPLWITDETFTSSVDHAHAVCDKLRERAQRGWRAQTRLDSIDAHMLRLMKASACHTVAFGIEVPSDDGLNLFGKREAIDRAEYAFRSAHEAGLRVQAILVFGAAEDRSSFQEVFDALRALRPDSLQSYIYHPVPGSPWWRRHGAQLPLVRPEDWNALDFHSPPVGSAAENGRESVARLLASIVWSSEGQVDRHLQVWSDTLSIIHRCPSCATGIRADVLHEVEPVAIVRLTTEHIDDGEILLAIGPTEAVACPTRVQGNIHAALWYVSDLPVNERIPSICPRCARNAKIIRASQAIVEQPSLVDSRTFTGSPLVTEAI